MAHKIEIPPATRKKWHGITAEDLPASAKDQRASIEPLLAAVVDAGHTRFAILEPVVLAYARSHRMTVEAAIRDLIEELDLLHYHHYGSHRHGR